MPEQTVTDARELERMLRTIPNSAVEHRFEPILDYERRDPGDRWDTHIYGRGIVLVDRFAREEAGKGGWTLGGRRLVLMRNRALVEQTRIGTEVRDGTATWWAGHAGRGGATEALQLEEVLARGYGAQMPAAIAGVLYKAIDRHQSMIRKLELAAQAVLAGHNVPAPVETDLRASLMKLEAQLRDTSRTLTCDDVRQRVAEILRATKP